MTRKKHSVKGAHECPLPFQRVLAEYGDQHGGPARTFIELNAELILQTNPIELLERFGIPRIQTPALIFSMPIVQSNPRFRLPMLMITLLQELKASLETGDVRFWRGMADFMEARKRPPVDKLRLYLLQRILRDIWPGGNLNEDFDPPSLRELKADILRDLRMEIVPRNLRRVCRQICFPLNPRPGRPKGRRPK